MWRGSHRGRACSRGRHGGQPCSRGHRSPRNGGSIPEKAGCPWLLRLPLPGGCGWSLTKLQAGRGRPWHAAAAARCCLRHWLPVRRPLLLHLLLLHSPPLLHRAGSIERESRRRERHGRQCCETSHWLRKLVGRPNHWRARHWRAWYGGAGGHGGHSRRSIHAARLPVDRRHHDGGDGVACMEVSRFEAKHGWAA